MKTVMERLQEHYDEALQYFPEDRIVGIFLQGSQNYGVDTEESDVDSKLVVLPSVDDIIFNRKPVSTTHIRENQEHIDFKDLRLMLQLFKKQNLNILEILFTNFYILNPRYEKFWNLLVQNRERIARYDEFAAVKSMKGIALEKAHALEHPYPSKLAILAKFGYDPKQLHHLIRIEEYLERYLMGISYQDCLKPHNPDFHRAVKRGEVFSLETARQAAKKSVAHIEMMAEIDRADYEKDVAVEALLDMVQGEIIKANLAYQLASDKS